MTMLTVTLNPSLDVSVRIPIVEPDRKLHCTDVLVEPGGGGVNVARVAHALGADVTAVVLAGGCIGEQLLDLLAEQGVAASPVAIADATRQDLTVVETSTGRQYRFLLPGPELSRSELAATGDRVAELASTASHVVVSGSLPPSVSDVDFTTLLQKARSTGALVIVDTSGHALVVAARAGAELIKPSVHELSQFAGCELREEHDVEAAARRLLDSGAGQGGAVVVSLGAAGALIVRDTGDSLRVHAPSVRTVSTVGAGDSLVAGMSVALERGEDLEQAVRWGVAAGTAATLSSGTGLCSRPDVERLLPHVSVSPIPPR